jgi:hypothetical protein
MKPRRAVRPDEDLRADIAELRAELAALRVEVGALKAAQFLRGSDHDWLTVIAGAMPRESFTVQALLERAERQRPLQLALAGLSARTIGARLRRLARQLPPGFTLTLDGRNNAGCIWTLSHLDACGPGDAAV